MGELAQTRTAPPGRAAAARALPPAAMTQVRRAVLVEGVSDAAALQTLSTRFGDPLRRREVAVVPMGGATNVRRYTELLGEQGLGLPLTGLCDVGEERFFRAVLPAEAVLVCRADLEEELIRSLGIAATIDVIEEQGEGSAWQLFRRQPAQRERSPAAQLRRFLGTHSGRKERYAAAMSAVIGHDRVPAPLAAVLTDTDEEERDDAQLSIDVPPRDDALGTLRAGGLRQHRRRSGP